MKAAAKKVAVGVIGGVVLLIGLAMIVLPGPAVVVIPAGLAILATEFAWAEELKHKTMARLHEMRERHRARRRRSNRANSTV